MTIAPVYLKRSQPGLFIGALTVTGQTTDAAGNIFVIDAQDADTTFGAPQPIDVAVQRWMTDGAVASTQGHENREIYFKVKVSAATSVALAAGEGALAKLAGEPTLLSWIPPEGSPVAPTTVFEVWTWHLEPEYDGNREISLSRIYGVRMTAKPWARSLNLTTSNAPISPGSATILSIDTCASLTPVTPFAATWTGTPQPATTSGGAVRETNTGGAGHRALIRTGSVTGLAALPYLTLDMTFTGPILSSSTVVTIGGVVLSKVAQFGTVSYYAFPAGTSSFTTLKVDVTYDVTHGGTFALSIADINATDTLGAIGSIGSRKMLTRHLDVGGSVKTSGSIQLASPSATVLGSCLVYTSPDDGSGYSPPMRIFRTSGNTVTADTTCISGNREAFVNAGVSAGAILYSVPVQVLPEGEYVIVARYIFGAAATITHTVSSGGGGSAVNVVGKVSAPGAGRWWGVVGSLSLPSNSQPAEGATNVSFLTFGTANTGTHTLDELLLVNVTRGSLSLVANAASPTYTRIWFDAPDNDPSRNRPAIYVGTQADRTDALTPDPLLIYSVGDHDLDPAGASLFTVTEGVNDAAANATFYHRWHTHAGD